MHLPNRAVRRAVAYGVSLYRTRQRWEYAVERIRAMMNDDKNSDMPDRMNIWTTIGGYALGATIIFIMFYWALPATSLN